MSADEISSFSTESKTVILEKQTVIVNYWSQMSARIKSKISPLSKVLKETCSSERPLNPSGVS